jgi:hypothetical protein
MKTIELTKGVNATVDDDAYAFLVFHNWHLLKGSYDRIGYAGRTVKLNGKRCYIFMHHVIMPKIKGYEVDHINRDSLDNRRENLRYLTHKENCSRSKSPCEKVSNRPHYNKNKNGGI